MAAPSRPTPLLLLLAAAAAALVATAAPAAASNTTDALAALRRDADALHPWLVTTRRALHRTPELMFREHNTSAYIRAALDELGIPYAWPVARTGVLARLDVGPGTDDEDAAGKKNANAASPSALAALDPTSTVVLRADIDALPITEPSGGVADRDGFASQNPGVMHACGHDAHVAMLLGAARLVKQRRASPSSFPRRGTVLLAFQPAEEGGAGADEMLKADKGQLFKGAGAAFGLHVWPTMPKGSLATRGGTLMAGALSWDVTVRGRGGHAALPHLNIDPIVPAAALVGSLQALVSRETSPLGSAVLSATTLQGGTVNNVTPDFAKVGGTLRALTHGDMARLRRRIEEVAQGIAAAHGCTAEVDWHEEDHPYYPPTVNDGRAAGLVAEVAERLMSGWVQEPPEELRRAAAAGGGGDEDNGKNKNKKKAAAPSPPPVGTVLQPYTPTSRHVFETEPVMPAEDFSFFARALPAAFSFIGAADPKGSAGGGGGLLHNPRFSLDEGVLPVGAALHAAVAAEYLARGGLEAAGGCSSAAGGGVCAAAAPAAAAA
jgi:IAA-amino acid hydrolase